MKPTFTIGIEEEYQTIDPVTRDLRSHIHAEMIEKGKLLLQERVKSEMHQSVVEVGTRVCANIKDAKKEVVKLRRDMVTLAKENNLRLASAATHPFADWRVQEIYPDERYHNIVEDMQLVARANLIFPLNWDEIFQYIGFPAFLKPFDGGGWKDVYKVHSPDEFFRAYSESGRLCMTLQRGVEFQEYFRCYVVGQEKVHIMQYNPRVPFHERYVKNPPPIEPKLLERVERDCRTLCRALGYDLNTVEFAVENGVPYAIDFMNPAPDADVNSVGKENFDWIVNAVAEFAVKKALSDENTAKELRWAAFLRGDTGETAAVKKAKVNK